MLIMLTKRVFAQACCSPADLGEDRSNNSDYAYEAESFATKRVFAQLLYQKHRNNSDYAYEASFCLSLL